MSYKKKITENIVNASIEVCIQLKVGKAIWVCGEKYKRKESNLQSNKKVTRKIA